MSDYTNYDAAIQAIQDAQQAVDSKYKAIGDASSTLCDVNQTIIQVPDGSVTRNRNGDVIGYDYKYTTPELPDIGIIGVDSNTDSGAFPEASGGGGSASGGGAGRYRGSYYAGEVVTDQGSTDKAKSTGLVSSLISSTWAGVSALAKFGKNVAADAGDALATFTENFGQNFGNLCVDLADAQADSIRALFGVDNQGNTSMYLDEDTIGALAIQARDDGFFGAGAGGIEPLDEYIPKNSNWVLNSRSHYNFPFYIYPGGSYGITRFRDSTMSTVTIHYTITTDAEYVFYQKFEGGYNYSTYNLLSAASRRSFTYTIIEENLQTGGYVTRERTPSSTVIDGNTYYFISAPSGGNIYCMPDYLIVNACEVGNGTDVVKLCYNSDLTPSPAIPGISDQTGATSVVDAITGADPHAVAQNLVSQYPDVMGTPVQVVVMDDSCNEKTINYYKVPISYSPTNLNISAPITGGLQVSPSFNPDVQLGLPDINMDNYIDQIIKTLGGSGAGRGVTKEPVPSSDPNIPSANIGGGGVPYEAPNTGTGDTPPTTDPSVAVESMWHVYYATPEQLSALGQWLWSSNIIDQIVRMFQNPMEAIMGVHALYVAPRFSGQVPIVVGNLTSTSNAHPLEAQYQALDCGSVWLTEYFGNVFDYDPFTEVSLYLPFVGIVKLDTADVMRARISVIYGIDCYTGACLAKVSINRDGAGGVLYEYPGNCAVEYPVSGASYSRMLQSIVAAAMSAVAVGIKTGGAPGTEALGAAAAGAAFLGSGEKISIQRAGSLGGNAGAMGAKIPYLIISRPQPNTAYLFPHYQGIPVNKTVRVSECSGFQRFSSIHLKCPFAYKEELEEIEMLLTKGILI